MAKRVNIPLETIDECLEELQNPEGVTLQRLADRLGVSYGFLYSRLRSRAGKKWSKIAKQQKSRATKRGNRSFRND